MALGEVALRTVVVAIGVPVAAIAIYLGEWVLAGVLALVAAAGALEFFRMVSARGVRPFAFAGAALAGAFLLVAAAEPTFAGAAPALWTLTVAAVLLLSAAAIWRRGPDGQPMLSVATTVLGAAYAGGTLSFAIFLRHPQGGAEAAPWAGIALVTFPVVLTWINDSFAFFVGRTWGRTRLIARVSPGKTVEGAIAGVVGTTAFGALFAAVVFGAWTAVPVGVGAGALAGGAIAVVAQVGDLVESLFKRDAGVKDSGALLPGHGGILDRFDALFYTLPAGYAILGLLVPFGAGAAWP